ncbi:MAG: DUF3825 domain-containing protein [Bacteroidia bacterium]|nr:DUF3825 domain-containing protein [Bacteroidia bacterium]
MELGVVSFFHITRGFGRIRTSDRPDGIFVHYGDVEGSAKILVENEMVQFQVAETTKGLRARHVVRLTERLRGVITHMNRGLATITDEAGRCWLLSAHDIVGPGIRRLQIGWALEFSPFESETGLQAKEAIIVDAREPLERFADMHDWDNVLQELARLAEPEAWDYQDHRTGEMPVLDNYLRHTYRRLEHEGKIIFGQQTTDSRIAAFHTGLYTTEDSAIYLFFTPLRRRWRPDSYLRPPSWQPDGIGTESDRRLAWLSRKPQPARFWTQTSELVFDPDRTLLTDYDHILRERLERFPGWFQHLSQAERRHRLTFAAEFAVRRACRMPTLAIPQYYDGAIQLLLPLYLSEAVHADLALVVSQEGEMYRAATVLPLDLARQNARLIGPHRAFSWL